MTESASTRPPASDSNKGRKRVVLALTLVIVIAAGVAASRLLISEKSAAVASFPVQQGEFVITIELRGGEPVIVHFQSRLNGTGIITGEPARLLEMDFKPGALAGVVVLGPAQGDHRVQHVLAPTGAALDAGFRSMVDEQDAQAAPS